MNSAARWKRVVAFVIDIVIVLFMTTLVVYIAIKFFEDGGVSTGSPFMLSFLKILLMTTYFIALIYFVTLHSTRSQATIGKRFMRLRLVNVDQRHEVTIGKAMIRFIVGSVSMLFFMVGPLYSLVDKQKRSLQDLVEKMLVIDK